MWGRFDEGIAELKRAQEMDPLSLLVPALIGWTNYFARRFDDAIEHYLPLLEMDPEFMVGHWFLGEALSELGRNEEGVAELERAAELSDRSSRSLAYLGYGYGKGSPSKVRFVAEIAVFVDRPYLDGVDVRDGRHTNPRKRLFFSMFATLEGLTVRVQSMKKLMHS